jgi:hypothetical protein
MSQFIVSGVATIEARDPLSAWQQAHQESEKLRWEVASIAPADHPERAVGFTTTVGERIHRAQARRQLVLATIVMGALAFPSHLALATLFPGI